MKVVPIKRITLFRLYVSLKTEIKSTYIPPQMKVIKGEQKPEYQLA